MKNIILILIILLTSCTTSIYQIITECDKLTDKIFRQISNLLLAEDIKPTVMDLELGYLEAESPVLRERFVGKHIRQWTFKSNNGVIIAFAKIIELDESGNIIQTKYFYDNAPESWSWYWNVRNGLENLCDGKVYFIRK